MSKLTVTFNSRDEIEVCIQALLKNHPNSQSLKNAAHVITVLESAVEVVEAKKSKQLKAVKKES